MTRRFVVESETVALRTNRIHARWELEPGERVHLRGWFWARSPVRRAQGVEREQILDVGEQQLLMLLLVMQAESHAKHDIGIALSVEAGKEFGHVFVHVSAITIHVLCRRS